jgi:hypothetical protein
MEKAVTVGFFLLLGLMVFASGLDLAALDSTTVLKS